MKSQLFLLALLLCATTLWGVEKEFPTKQINHGSKFDSTRVMSDTRLKAVDETLADQTTLNATIEKYLPWAVALLISVASVLLNFGIAKDLRELNEKKMQLQAETIERTLRNHLDKSLDSQLQYLKKMVIAKDKQQWLDEVNICIVNYLTNIEFVQPKVKALYERADFIGYVEKVLLYKSKIEILLTGQTDSQKEVLKAMKEFSKILTMGQHEYKDDLFEGKKNKLLLATRNLYKDYQRRTV